MKNFSLAFFLSVLPCGLAVAGFDDWDRDGDKKLSKEEVPPPMRDSYFDQKDLDGDGYWTRAEFNGAVRPPPPPAPAKEVSLSMLSIPSKGAPGRLPEGFAGRWDGESGDILLLEREKGFAGVFRFRDAETELEHISPLIGRQVEGGVVKFTVPSDLSGGDSFELTLDGTKLKGSLVTTPKLCAARGPHTLIRGSDSWVSPFGSS